MEGESFALPSQPATSLALVVNELVQNAVQHAFAGRDAGHIRLELGQEPGRWVIAVRDDGVGLPEAASRSLGLQIVRTLVSEDLRGELCLASGAGTTATVTLPRPPAREGRGGAPCAS